MGKSTIANSGNAITIIHRSQIQSAQAVLRSKAAISDHAVHAARKDIKRARASLRLLRGIIGERRYTAQNTRLRDAGRPLSRIRDAKVLLDTAESLRDEVEKHQGREALRNLTTVLNSERLEIRKAMLKESPDLKQSLAKLVVSEQATTCWSWDKSDKPLTKTLGGLYRKGRKALSRAREASNDEAFHEARKQSKYLVLALEALEGGSISLPGNAIKHGKSIGDDLGLDHDLALIHSKLMKLLPLSATMALSQQIQRKRAKLQSHAFQLGEKLYKRKSRAFVKRLSIS